MPGRNAYDRSAHRKNDNDELSIRTKASVGCSCCCRVQFHPFTATYYSTVVTAKSLSTRLGSTVLIVSNAAKVVVAPQVTAKLYGHIA